MLLQSKIMYAASCLPAVDLEKLGGSTKLSCGLLAADLMSASDFGISVITVEIGSTELVVICINKTASLASKLNEKIIFIRHRPAGVVSCQLRLGQALQLNSAENQFSAKLQLLSRNLVSKPRDSTS